MDDDLWDKKYIVAFFKGLFLSFLLNIFVILSYMFYLYIKSGNSYFNLNFIGSPFFYLNDILITLIIIGFFMYSSRDIL